MTSFWKTFKNPSANQLCKSLPRRPTSTAHSQSDSYIAVSLTDFSSPRAHQQISLLAQFFFSNLNKEYVRRPCCLQTRSQAADLRGSYLLICWAIDVAICCCADWLMYWFFFSFLFLLKINAPSAESENDKQVQGVLAENNSYSLCKTTKW